MGEYLNYLSFGNGGWAKPILSGALLTIELRLQRCRLVWL